MRPDPDAWLARPQPSEELCRLFHGISCPKQCGPCHAGPAHGLARRRKSFGVLCDACWAATSALVQRVSRRTA